MTTRVTNGEWHHRLVCPCGFHIRPRVMDDNCCPECGIARARMEVRTMRIVRTTTKRWWFFDTTAEHWETTNNPTVEVGRGVGQ